MTLMRLRRLAAACFGNISYTDVTHRVMEGMNMFDRYTLSLACMLLLTAAPLLADDYALARRELVELIEQDVRDTSLYLDREALDPRVMAALGRVPRHEFVPDSERKYAYENRPLAIGHGQTISQPYIVALMTDLVRLKAGDTALEIGTGSGYQAAVLAELASRVFSIEIIEELGKQAAERLSRLGYDNVTTRTGDGYYGWEQHAPFDVIVVTAAAGHVPPPLLAQLKPGGRMVIPVGSSFLTQQLVLIEKHADGELVTRQIVPVMFVPLTGEHD
jgi:protein-L-isoaspartate(D-aspartate) O-methyltransferase